MNPQPETPTKKKAQQPQLCYTRSRQSNKKAPIMSALIDVFVSGPNRLQDTDETPYQERQFAMNSIAPCAQKGNIPSQSLPFVTFDREEVITNA